MFPRLSKQLVKKLELRMGYSDFLMLVKQNTSNKLDGYKDLCLICLENQPNGVDITENSYSSIKRREAIRSNYTIITKKYLPTSDEYPKFVCPACERNLDQFALFAQQVGENAENWELFLANGRTDMPTDVVDVFKIEFCDEKSDNVPDTDTHILHAWELPPLKIEESEEVNTESLNESPPKPVQRTKKTTRSRKKCALKTSTEFERTCKHCDEPTFTSLERMYGHQRLMHPGIKIFSCDHCNATFISKDSLVRHMKDRHSNSGRKYQCQFCAKLFYSDREVKGHEKLHLNARSYVCSLCGKGFNQKTELNAHLRSKIHNSNYQRPKQYPRQYPPNKKVYRCVQCVPSTVHSSAEERASHRNLMHKIYECDVCKNSFLTFESLMSHTRLHSSKPRPHVCSICNATFNQSSHLSSHFKCKHAERRSHQCSLCDKEFSENFQLNQHMNLVHRKQQRAKCNECESDFATKKYLRKHILDKHSAKPSPYDCTECDMKSGCGEKLALHRLKHHK